MNKIPFSLLFSRLNSPSCLSLSSYDKGSKLLIISMALQSVLVCHSGESSSKLSTQMSLARPEPTEVSSPPPASRCASSSTQCSPGGWWSLLQDGTDFSQDSREIQGESTFPQEQLVCQVVFQQLLDFINFVLDHFSSLSRSP